MAVNIFISYRREDSAGYAGRLHSNLVSRFGQDRIFMDIDTIAPGADFLKEIERAVKSSAILIAVIGRQWANIKGDDGSLRLQDPNDIVSLEIITALEQGIRVIPILVDGATMPSPNNIPESLGRFVQKNAFEISNSRWDFDIDELIKHLEKIVCEPETGNDIESKSTINNPFIEREGITDVDAVFNRDSEMRLLRDYLRGRGNCQIVGPRRVGKTSLLQKVQQLAGNWSVDAKVGYLDLQDPRCKTLNGWFKQVARQYKWIEGPSSLMEFADSVEKMLEDGSHPVLCLDEFGEISSRRDEFDRDFLITLRFCGQKGMSIITAASKDLSMLTDPNDQTSPFFNTFPILKLGVFAADDAEDYLSIHRPNVSPFSTEEKHAILEFAEGHPLALQVACYHVLESRVSNYSLHKALNKSEDELRSLKFSRT